MNIRYIQNPGENSGHFTGAVPLNTEIQCFAKNSQNDIFYTVFEKEGDYQVFVGPKNKMEEAEVKNSQIPENGSKEVSLEFLIKGRFSTLSFVPESDSVPALKYGHGETVNLTRIK